MDEILIRPGRAEFREHPGDEDLARLAEGRVRGAEKEELIRHVNRCPRCHAVLAGTLEDMAGAGRRSLLSRLTRPRYALAASIVLALLIGVGIFQQLGDSPDLLMATLIMNPEMKDLVLEGQVKGWADPERTGRLAGLLRKNGIKVTDITKVVLAKPYLPTKSFLGPEEKLKVRIEGGVVYLEVVEEKQATDPKD